MQEIFVSQLQELDSFDVGILGVFAVPFAMNSWWTLSISIKMKNCTVVGIMLKQWSLDALPVMRWVLLDNAPNYLHLLGWVIQKRSVLSCHFCDAVAHFFCAIFLLLIAPSKISENCYNPTHSRSSCQLSLLRVKFLSYMATGSCKASYKSENENSID